VTGESDGVFGEGRVPRVSVVIPTKDRQARVLQAVASVRSQEGVEVEILVIDDGSSDGTSAKLAGIGGVRVVRHEASRGVAVSRNRGIEESTAPWVAFLDDDDLWAPGKLAAQLAAAAEQDAPWVYASAHVVDEAGRLLWTETAPTADEIAWAITRYNPLPAGSSNVLARRALLTQAGGFDPQLAHLADWDLWARLLAVHPPACVAEPLLAYVTHPTNMHVSAIGTVESELDVLARKLRASTGRELDRRALPLWIAAGHARAGDHRRAIATLLRAALDHRSRDHLLAAGRTAVKATALGGHLARRREGALERAPEWARPAAA
jgi:hypothetical protein